MDIIFSETQKFDVRKKFKDYKYFNLDDYLKMSELPKTWKTHEKEFRKFLKDCDISDNSIECGYDKLSLFYIIFLIFNLLETKNNKIIINNFGYSMHPLLRKQLLLRFSKYKDLCLMTDNIDLIDELIFIIDPKNVYINTLNVQDNKIIFNELLTLEECCERKNNSLDIEHIVNRFIEEGDRKCQPWITML